MSQVFSFDEVIQIAQEIFIEVKKDVNNEYKNNSQFARNFNDISQFGPLDNFVFEEILKRLLKGGGGEGEESGDDDSGYHINKLKEFAESAEKFLGKEGSFFRKVILEKKKINPAFIANILFNQLHKGGYVRQRIVFPNKAIYGRTNVIPGKRKFFGMEVAIIIDTSGSMSMEEIAPGVAIGYSLLEVGCNLLIYFNDTQFQKLELDSPVKLKKFILEKEILGGGGSVFNAVFKEVKKKGIGGLLITDLYIEGLDELPQNFVVLVTKQHDTGNRRKLENKGYLVFNLEDIAR